MVLFPRPGQIRLHSSTLLETCNLKAPENSHMQKSHHQSPFPSSNCSSTNTPQYTTTTSLSKTNHASPLPPSLHSHPHLRPKEMRRPPPRRRHWMRTESPRTLRGLSHEPRFPRVHLRLGSGGRCVPEELLQNIWKASDVCKGVSCRQIFGLCPAEG